MSCCVVSVSLVMDHNMILVVMMAIVTHFMRQIETILMQPPNESPSAIVVYMFKKRIKTRAWDDQIWPGVGIISAVLWSYCKESRIGEEEGGRIILQVPTGIKFTTIWFHGNGLNYLAPCWRVEYHCFKHGASLWTDGQSVVYAGRDHNIKNHLDIRSFCYRFNFWIVIQLSFPLHLRIIIICTTDHGWW